MTKYRKQSKQPKPLTQQQLIDQFRRGMAQHGYSVDVATGSGLYTPALSLQAWPKQERRQDGERA